MIIAETESLIRDNDIPFTKSKISPSIRGRRPDNLGRYLPRRNQHCNLATKIARDF
jgi:hypothetical protein